MEVARQEIDDINDPKLRYEVLALIRQEGAHARWHRHTNTILAKRYPAIRLFTFFQSKFMQLLKRLLPATSIPAAFEYFTGTLAATYTENRGLICGRKRNELIKFLDWHALEELEHQSVCLDLYRAKYPNHKLLLPILLVTLWMPLTLVAVFGTQLYFMLKDGLIWKAANLRLFAFWTMRITMELIRELPGYCRSGAAHWSNNKHATYQLAKCHFQEHS